MLNSEELIRYNRHFTLPQVGVEGQARLKKAKVLCVGAGGLGSPLLLYLAAAGVGTLGIMDDDVVELSNLQRQIIYSTEDLHQSKALTAKKKLSALNPFITVHAYNERLTEKNSLAILNDYDIIADGSDNFATRYLINDACFHLKKPYVFASIYQFAGQVSIFNPDETGCYRCLFPETSENIPDCNTGGVLGVLPGIIGSLQATELLKFILQIGETLSGRLLTFDALTMQSKIIALSKNPECVICTKQKTFHQLHHPQSCTSKNDDEIDMVILQKMIAEKTDFILLDVRTPEEYASQNLNGKLIPLTELENHIPQLDKQKLYVTHCQTGLRSAKAAEILKKHGFKVKNLQCKLKQTSE